MVWIHAYNAHSVIPAVYFPLPSFSLPLTFSSPLNFPPLPFSLFLLSLSSSPSSYSPSSSSPSSSSPSPPLPLPPLPLPPLPLPPLPLPPPHPPRTFLSATRVGSLAPSVAAQSVHTTATGAMTVHSSEPAQLPIVTAGRGGSVVLLLQVTMHSVR